MPGSPLPPQARWALTSLALSMLMPSLDTSIANAGLPTLAAAFNATFQQVQWIVLAYLLAVTTLIVSVGRLGDVFGRRRLLLIGIGPGNPRQITLEAIDEDQRRVRIHAPTSRGQAWLLAHMKGAAHGA